MAHPPIFHTTPLGAAYHGDSLDLLRDLPRGSINLVMTSPPFALIRKKEYGNESQQAYVSWFCVFAREVRRVLRDDGSFVIDIGGAWELGRPTRSLYQFKLLITLVEELDFYLAQEFFWYNPAKIPAPAEWATIRRIRVKDSVNCVWWLSKTPYPKADNRKVLVPYSLSMERCIKRGCKARQCPSGHKITTERWADNGGAICSNLFTCGNSDSNSRYLRRCREAGVKPHPARFPSRLPEFFIAFLTDPGDLVLDIFGGSNTTGATAERMGRRWLTCEMNENYLKGSLFRFDADDVPINDEAPVKDQSVPFMAVIGPG